MIDLNGLDIVFLIVIVLVAFRAAIRGFVHEFLSMAAVMVGIAVAVIASGRVAPYIEPYVSSASWSQVIAFLALFVVVYLVIRMVETSLNRLVEHINLESLDRALGFLFGVVEGVVISFGALVLLQVQPIVDASGWITESFIARLLLPLAPYARRIILVGGSCLRTFWG